MFKTKYLIAPSVTTTECPYTPEELKKLEQLQNDCIEAEKYLTSLYGVREGLDELERFAERRRENDS